MATTPTVGTEVLVSTDPTVEFPRITPLSDGTFVLSSQTTQNANVATHFNEAGIRDSRNFLTDDIGQTKPPPLLVQESDGTVIAYTEVSIPAETDVTWARVDPSFDGTTSTSAHTAPGIDHLVDAVATQQGTAAAFETTDASGNVHTELRFIGPDGAFTTPPTDVLVEPTDAPGSERNAALASSGTDTAIVAYAHVDNSTGASDVRLQTVSPSGTGGNPIILSDETTHANFPDITKLPDGSFVVVWQDDLGLVMNHVTSAGVVDAANRIGGAQEGLLPKVTALKDGSFIVAWEAAAGTESDGSPNEDVFARRFTIVPQSGGALPNVITDVGDTIHLAQPGDQAQISLATLTDGRVVLAYTSETGDSTNVNNLVYRILDTRDSTLTGTENADGIVATQTGSTVNGLGGNDILVGGAGNDVLDGGAGIDTAKFDGVLAPVNVDLAKGTATGQGTDTLRNIENVTGSDLDDTILGDAGNNVIDGSLGNDILDGRGGNNTVSFQSGFPTGVTVDLSKGTAIGKGIDTLRNFQNIIGSNQSDTLIGNNGANVIDDGGSGAFGSNFDTMQGLGGNDTYIVSTAFDVIKEAPGQGTDTVLTNKSSYTLAAGQSIEKLATTDPNDTTPVNLTGNELSQAIIGNAGPNFITSGGGNDTLTGGGGADTFVLSIDPNGKIAATITDFDPTMDKIQLDKSMFPAMGATGVVSDSAFFAGSAANTASDHIVYNPSTGALSYDSNGSAPGGTTVFAKLSPGLALHASNFDVV